MIRFALLVSTAMLFTTPAMQTADTPSVAATAQGRVEATDSRATGRLVRVDPSGKRTTEAVAIKERWFPGVLRVLIELTPAHGADAGSVPDSRVSILLEMRPNGGSTVRTFHPHEVTPTVLPVEKWGESVSGTDFNYEDFLQPELFWHDQKPLKEAKIGTHLCTVLRSVPDAADHSQYAEVQTWIDETIGFPIYVEKTPKHGGPAKQFTSFGLTQSGGVWAAKQVEVKLGGHPGSTLLILERGTAKAHLGAADFSPEMIARFEDHP